MNKWQCRMCGHIYNPECGEPDQDIEPGIPFEKLPDDWVCPTCGAGKEHFVKIE